MLSLISINRYWRILAPYCHFLQAKCFFSEANGVSMIGGMAFVGGSTEIGCDWKRAKGGCESPVDERNLNDVTRVVDFSHDSMIYMQVCYIQNWLVIALSLPNRRHRGKLCEVMRSCDFQPLTCWKWTRWWWIPGHEGLSCLGNHWKSRLSSQRYHQETCSFCGDLELCNRLAIWSFCRGPPVPSRWMSSWLVRMYCMIFGKGSKHHTWQIGERWHPDIARPSLSHDFSYDQ